MVWYKYLTKHTYAVSILFFNIYTVSKKRVILPWNNFFKSWLIFRILPLLVSLLNFEQNDVITLPTAPKLCCRITSKNLNLHFFCFSAYCTVPIKGTYQAHCGNIIISWTNLCLTWDFTDRSVSLQHIFLTQKQIVNEINSFFSALLPVLPPPVSLLTVPVSLNFAAALWCNLWPPVVWKFIY